jgi:hypothetical protein
VALLAVAGAVIGVAGIAAFAIAHPQLDDLAPAEPARANHAGGVVVEATPRAVPDRVWTVSLRDDLFPPAPPEPAPPQAPKPPELSLRVIATGDRGVFVFDEVNAEHLWLRVGDHSASGAVVKSIADSLVVFELDGRQLQREVER